MGQLFFMRRQGQYNFLLFLKKNLLFFASSAMRKHHFAIRSCSYACVVQWQLATMRRWPCSMWFVAFVGGVVMGKSLQSIFMCACFVPQRLNVACRAWLLECKSKKDLADFIKFARCMRREFDKRKMRGSARRFKHWYDVAVRLYLMGGDYINTAYSATDFANCNAAPNCKVLVQGDLKTHNYAVYKIGVRGQV